MINYTIEKKLKTATILKYVMISSIILALLSFIIGATAKISPLFESGVIFCIIAIPTSITYIEAFHPLCKSVKFLYRFGLQDTMNDLSTTEFNLPISKIYMGSKAFFAKNPATILPYSMVAWVYIQHTKYIGIPFDERVIVCCRDGSSFEIRANRNELQMLLQVVYEYSPDLIVGYGRSQAKQYNIIIENFSKQTCRVSNNCETRYGNIFCPRCGEKLPNDTAFCPKCGNRIL